MKESTFWKLFCASLVGFVVLVLSHPHNFYCSNNFVESFLGETSFVDMEKKSRNEDRAIKQEFSAEQLLRYYQQGLDLQDKLVRLYLKGLEDGSAQETAVAAAGNDR